MKEEIRPAAYTSSARRIARNTLMLYFRQILIMLVSLYTVRVVLGTLGAEDYGVYNVVAGVVTMFGFLSGAMATASQRFLSFELGRGDPERLRKTFSVTLCIYILLTLVIAALAETLGLWFVGARLVIPAGRMAAARRVYQTAVLNFAVTLLTAPYMAAIIAHEDMSVYACVSVAEAALKLAAALALKVLPFDRLTLYGVLTLAAAAVTTALYRAHCRLRYAECSFRPAWDGAMFREICGFTGWSIFGAFTSMLRAQAVTILVNQFFNSIVVAARAISTQVTNALTVFSTNFNVSLYAPIVKEYAADRQNEMFSLIFNGCKMTFFLMWIFALPLCLRMEYVLALWLKNVPEWAAAFTVLSVIEVVINSICLPVQTAARAAGEVKLYEISLGSMQVLMFIACFVWLKFFGGKPTAVYWAAIILNAAMFFVRLLIVRVLVGLSLRKFFTEVAVPVILIFTVSALPSYFVNSVLPQNFISLCAVVAVSFCLSSAMMFFAGINADMRRRIVGKIFRRNANA